MTSFNSVIPGKSIQNQMPFAPFSCLHPLYYFSASNCLPLQRLPSHLFRSNMVIGQLLSIIKWMKKTLRKLGSSVSTVRNQLLSTFSPQPHLILNAMLRYWDMQKQNFAYQQTLFKKFRAWNVTSLCAIINIYILLPQCVSLSQQISESNNERVWNRAGSANCWFWLKKAFRGNRGFFFFGYCLVTEFQGRFSRDLPLLRSILPSMPSGGLSSLQGENDKLELI